MSEPKPDTPRSGDRPTKIDKDKLNEVAKELHLRKIKRGEKP